MSSGAITAFLRAVRRRLWLESALRGLRTAAWGASATLLLFAALHVLWQPVALGAAMTVALVAGLIVMLPTLFSRPALEECALRADRHFGGHALLTTANEIDEAAQRGPAEKTVQNRALAASAAWRSRLDEMWHAPPRSGYVLAVIPVFFAVLLLQLPAEQESAAGPSLETSQPEGELMATTSALDTAGSLAEVREAIVQGAAEEAVESDRRPATGTAQLDDDDSQSLPASIEIAKEAAGEPGIAGADQDGGAAPGDARRRPADAGLEQPEAAPDFTQVMTASLERHGRRAAGSRETGAVFSSASDGPELIISPVPAPPAVSSWTSLSDAELAYARRYLELKDQNNE